MLRRSKTAAGYCINCATHDWLRNTYPVNIELARAGPRMLLYPHVRTLFAELLCTARSDARIDEINWNLIVENWELPFLDPVKATAMNPCSQQELDRIAAEPEAQQRAVAFECSLLEKDAVIRSFDDLDRIDPGLGTNLKRHLDRQIRGDRDKSNDSQPPIQQELF